MLKETSSLWAYTLGISTIGKEMKSKRASQHEVRVTKTHKTTRRETELIPLYAQGILVQNNFQGIKDRPTEFKGDYSKTKFSNIKRDNT